MDYQMLLSPKWKRLTIITYKHGMYELPYELPNDLRLRILGNMKILGKCLNLIEWWPSAQSPFQNKSFVCTGKKVPKNSD